MSTYKKVKRKEQNLSSIRMLIQNNQFLKVFKRKIQYVTFCDFELPLGPNLILLKYVIS